MTSTNKNGIYIGTSGYSYKDWLGNFYPQFCPAADFLRFYATVFNTVEIDSTYYRIPRKDSVAKWYKTTPDDFVFSAKFPANVTHEGDIKTRVDNTAAFIDVMRRLENKLGPLLLQFPYSFKPEEHFEIMEKLVSIMPGDLKIAVEVRNRKWLKSDFYELLRSRNITLALVEHPWMPRVTEYTGQFAYIRLLGDRKIIDSDFSYIRDDREEDLKWWSHLVEEFSRDRGEAYIYLNNHFSGHSPTSARRLMELLGMTS